MYTEKKITSSDKVIIFWITALFQIFLTIAMFLNDK